MKKKNKSAKKAKSVKKSVSRVAASSAPAQNRSGVTPMGDRVLIKPFSIEEMEGTTTSFGIIIPDTSKEKPEQGVVVAVGSGRRTDDGKILPVSVAVGDKVMFSKYGFDEVKVNGTQYYIVSETNILAVLQ